LPNPRPSAISISPATLTFGNLLIGAFSIQTVTIANFGGSPLDISSISATGDFSQTNNCPNSLVAGAGCTASVSFAPMVAGPAIGLLTINDDSGNLGASQTITLAGTGSSLGCGLGLELGIAAPLLMWLRSRRWRAVS